MKAKSTLGLFLRVFFRVFFRNYLVPIIFIYIIIKSLSVWYPHTFSFENKIFTVCCIAIFLYMLYTAYKISEEAVESVNYKRFLERIIKEPDGERFIITLYNDYSSDIEENKIRLDIYKSFTPIPIIVFLLSVLVKWDFTKFNTYINDIISFKFEFNSIVGVLLFFIGIWYSISYRKYWLYHKQLLKRYAYVKTAYEKLKSNIN